MAETMEALAILFASLTSPSIAASDSWAASSSRMLTTIPAEPSNALTQLILQIRCRSWRSSQIAQSDSTAIAAEIPVFSVTAPHHRASSANIRRPRKRFYSGAIVGLAACVFAVLVVLLWQKHGEKQPEESPEAAQKGGRNG